jgi:hypothetical protein
MSLIRYPLRASRDYNLGDRFRLDVARVSGFEAEGELFNDGVGEDFAGDSLDFKLGLCGVAGERVFEGKQEVLSLANISDARILHAAERASDSLPLSIEHGPLESDIHMRLHEF